MTRTSVSSLERSLKRTAKPTASPMPTPSSSAMRSATVRAAIRRGCVWPIAPRTPRPRPRQIFGSCVVFPLAAPDPPPHPPAPLEEGLGKLRPLPRAGLAGDDDDLVVADRLEQVLPA